MRTIGSPTSTGVGLRRKLLPQSSAMKDMDLLTCTRELNDRHDVVLYSEHLSFTSNDGQLYDLMPIYLPTRRSTTSPRTRQVQDVLGRRIAVENVSCHAAPYRRCQRPISSMPCWPRPTPDQSILPVLSGATS